MILDFHPDIPGKKYDKPFKFIGYWHSVSVMGDKFGGPVKTGHEFDRYEDKFGPAGLPLPNEYVDPAWNQEERLQVLAHLMLGKTFESWRGNSWCRFHGCKGDGHKSEGYLSGYRDMTDGTYVWPEAFPHYVEAHLVKPPEEFLRHVLHC